MQSHGDYHLAVHCLYCSLKLVKCKHSKPQIWCLSVYVSFMSFAFFGRNFNSAKRLFYASPEDQFAYITAHVYANFSTLGRFTIFISTLHNGIIIILQLHLNFHIFSNYFTSNTKSITIKMQIVNKLTMMIQNWIGKVCYQKGGQIEFIMPLIPLWFKYNAPCLQLYPM